MDMGFISHMGFIWGFVGGGAGGGQVVQNRKLGTT